MVAACCSIRSPNSLLRCASSAVARSEFLRQRGLTCQCRVEPLLQRCDDALRISYRVGLWRGHAFPWLVRTVTCRLPAIQYYSQPCLGPNLL